LMAGTVFGGAVLAGAGAPAVGAAIQSVRTIGVTNTVLANPATATAVATEVVGATAAVASGAVTPGASLVTAERTAVTTAVKEADAVSDTVANATQAAKLTREGKGIAAAETASPAMKGSVKAEVSVGAKPTAPIQETPKFESPKVEQEVVADSATYQVGRHGDMPSPRPAGHESHHGVNSVWTEANVPGSKAADAPAVLMPNAPDHNATRGVFNRWRAEIAQRQGVSPRNVDWEKVTPGEAWRLSEEQFQATNAPAEVVEEYFRQFNKHVEGLK
jgi:hypothetical protein